LLKIIEILGFFVGIIGNGGEGVLRNIYYKPLYIGLLLNLIFIFTAKITAIIIFVNGFLIL
jgi:hypothetical protein